MEVSRQDRGNSMVSLLESCLCCGHEVPENLSAKGLLL